MTTEQLYGWWAVITIIGLPVIVFLVWVLLMLASRRKEK